MKALTAKTIALAVGLGALLIIFIILFLDSSGSAVCGYWYVNGYPTNFCNVAILAMSPFLLLILFAPVFFFLQSLDAFYAWRRFSYWWLPLSVATTLMLTSGNHGGGLGIESALDGDIALLIMASLSLCYILISSVIIVRKWIESKHRP